jgi:hypothetical protein
MAFSIGDANRNCWTGVRVAESAETEGESRRDLESAVENPAEHHQENVWFL